MSQIMLPQSGWAYLHIVIDWGDKNLLAAHLRCTGKSQDWITALEQAVSSEFPQGIRDLSPDYDVPKLVSDHGSQPTSAAFRRGCETLGINQIFASYGNPRGNADTERMMRTIKEDLIYSNDFQTFNELETVLKAWMKRYNEEFLHSTLDFFASSCRKCRVCEATKVHLNTRTGSTMLQEEFHLIWCLEIIRRFWPVNVLASLEKGD